MSLLSMPAQARARLTTGRKRRELKRGLRLRPKHWVLHVGLLMRVIPSGLYLVDNY